MRHQIGFVGLGKMGRNMVLRLRSLGVDVVAYNRTPLADVSVATVPAIDELVRALSAPRVIWLMIPNGKPIDEVIEQVMNAGVSSGDTIIDGGNTFYKDTVRRSAALGDKGIHFIDCGTSGGLDGALTGACLMLGGEEAVVSGLSWLWDALAVPGGWSHMGPSGAGHFVKMVHNGVEYGMNEALGEGFDILANGPYHLDLVKIAKTWNRGSIVRSYLVELLERALEDDPRLEGFTGKVGGGQTGTWTANAARELGIDASVINDALRAREKSRTKPTFGSKVVSALRRQYGGHEEAI